MDNDSCTAFLCKVFVFIFGRHLFFAEIARFEFDVVANRRQILGVKYAVDLELVVGDGISKQETALFVGMTMEIEISKELSP